MSDIERFFSLIVETDASAKWQDGLNDNQDHKQKKQMTHYKSDK